MNSQSYQIIRGISQCATVLMRVLTLQADLGCHIVDETIELNTHGKGLGRVLNPEPPLPNKLSSVGESSELFRFTSVNPSIGQKTPAHLQIRPRHQNICITKAISWNSNHLEGIKITLT